MEQIVTANKKRIESIDLLRGIVMVIMVLDHVRDYFHADAFIYDPTDLTKTSVIVFVTRWITHYCAPVFMLLTGASAFLVGERRGARALSKFLFTRGLFLIVLELTIVNFAWTFNPRFPELDFLVLWSLGFSMMALSLMVYLPKKIILAIGIVLVAGHNLLDNVHVSGNNLVAFGWSLLHEPGTFNFGHTRFFVLYPIIPWVGIIAIGYTVGSLFAKTMNAAQRRKWLLITGSVLILLFIVIRAINVYGDIVPWSKQPSAIFTFLSFINVNKYPPSLLYTLLTLGPALILLALFEKAGNAVSKFFITFGRTAMFYYILHIFLFHIIAVFATSFCGHKWSDMIWDGFTNNHLGGYGFSLGVVYLVWIAVVLILYPLCKWYDGYKTSHKEKWWLSYL